jgi:hypothetical protein
MATVRFKSSPWLQGNEKKNKGEVKMKLSTAKAMVKRINDRYGEDTASLYENYSGRCMYGSETTGVVLPGWAISKRNKHMVDNMGRDMIIY